ncbi:MAG TPA: hypothetical protein VG738_05400 [Chitinophagaceae bacterium]|nr:hypothetical protein [Chitinophagaceae bacterium]
MLIGITFLDIDENIIERYQTHGKIISNGDKHGLVIEKADGTGRFSIPPGINNLHAAPPGEYHIKTTGEVVVNTDFTTTWIVNNTEDTNITNYKKSGFSNFYL